MHLPFANRQDAGRRLAAHLGAYASKPDTIVLGLPRGGVAVAYEVATGLHLPLDIFLVRKLGVPKHPELAFGAVASGGVRVLNEPLIAAESLDPAEVERVTRQEMEELARREAVYREGRAAADLAGQHVILIDDGLATGATMMAALRALKPLGARRSTMAVPVGPEPVVDAMDEEVDEIVCPYMPVPFRSVGLWYEDFRAVPDEEVVDYLARAGARYVRG